VEAIFVERGAFGKSRKMNLRPPFEHAYTLFLVPGWLYCYPGCINKCVVRILKTLIISLSFLVDVMLLKT
jgi:hypothetical protein